GVPVAFAQADFRALPTMPPADVVLLLYDGLNYLLDARDVARLFEGVARVLRPGGVFVVDQSTPANSLNHPDGFDDAGDAGAFTYLRTSRYDPEARLHTTRFRLDVAGRVYEETHVQRAYTAAEVEPLARAAGFAVEAAYDGFSDAPAGDATERIHWVLRIADRGMRTGGRGSSFDPKSPIRNPKSAIGRSARRAPQRLRLLPRPGRGGAHPRRQRPLGDAAEG